MLPHGFLLRTPTASTSYREQGPGGTPGDSGLLEGQAPRPGQPPRPGAILALRLARRPRRPERSAAIPRRPLLLLGLAAAVAAAAPARAHHALSDYDRTLQVSLQAVVEEFRFVNPHPQMVVRATADGSGQAGVRWTIEMDNMWELEAIGVRADSWIPGDRVVVTGDPDRQGRPAMYLRRLQRPKDGLTLEQATMQPRLVR